MKGRAAAGTAANGFTLVELLVSMTVLVLIVGLLSQLVSNASSSILGSTKGMDNTQLSALALDRIGNSLAGMITADTGTLVVYKNPDGSDGLAMLTNSRVRNRTGGDANINVGSFTDIRMGARGFCVISTLDSELPNPGSVPMLSWGDGTVTWSTGGGAAVNGERGDPTKALELAANDVVTPPTGGSVSGTMLNFSPLSRSIFRFELAFLLSDGTTISGSGGNLPRNKYFVPGEVFASPPATFPAKTYPLAFSAATSDVAANSTSNGQNVYVRAVIVGIASLDATTQKILTADQLTKLASLPTFPKCADGKTPLQTWDFSNPAGPTYPKIAPPNFPAPVLKNVRVTQRYYYVN